MPMRVMEVLLTAEIFNQNQELDINDLNPHCRDVFGAGNNGDSSVKRPLFASDGALERALGIHDAHALLEENPFVAYEEFGHRLRITALKPAAQWFIKKDGLHFVQNNPVLASFYEEFDSVGVKYEEVKSNNPRFEDTAVCLNAKISKIVAGSEEMRNARDLIIISAPEEIEQSLDDLVTTPQQEDSLRRITVAIKNQDFLRERGIHEIGKQLFVGPPGTGKTSFALSSSHQLHMPVLEVRLAMITSQYLGETSKNVDRIFEIARRLAPCILFIDEFDFVAKTRDADDHGAMKRAVNMLLKNIDHISLVRNGVLLIAATNHPWILDEAVWRRFDAVVEFPLPDPEMRKKILLKVTQSLDCTCDFDDLALRTEGLSGSDLRMIVKEGLLSALMRGSTTILQEDVEKYMESAGKRGHIRSLGKP